MSQCPDCRNEFVQPFVCTTCGAEKLYDATVREQASQIKRLTTLLNRTHIVLGLLTDDTEPPTLPAEWQPYADRTALVYGTINPENQHMAIEEVYVQDGPCDVTPATTHCQNWLQIVPETP